MNPRQRRGALLLIIAALGGLALVLALSAYVSDVQSRLGPVATQLRLVDDAPYLAEITPGMVETVEVPERYLPEGAVTTTAALAGRVAAADLAAGTVLQTSNLVAPPAIAAGEREVAVLLDPETGVGGKIQPGDVVDVYATFSGQSAETPDGVPLPATARVVLEGVRIIDVAPALGAAGDGAFAESNAVPVTFALSTEQALRLAYVESFAVEVRLGLRQRTDREPLGGASLEYEGE